MFAFAPHLHGPQKEVKTSKVMAHLSALESGGKGEICLPGSPLTPFQALFAGVLHTSRIYQLYLAVCRNFT